MTFSRFTKYSLLLWIAVSLFGCQNAWNSPFGIPLTEDPSYHNIEVKIIEKRGVETYTDTKIAAFNTISNKAYTVASNSFVKQSEETASQDSSTIYGIYAINISALTAYLEPAPPTICKNGGSTFAFYITSQNQGKEEYRELETILNAEKLPTSITTPFDCSEKLYYAQQKLRANGQDDLMLYKVYSSKGFKK